MPASLSPLHLLLQASIQDVSRPQEARQQALQAVADSQAVVPATGLRNATGEYNCFLNVIIQCLWHCGCFRSRIQSWEPEMYQVRAHLSPAAALTDQTETARGLTAKQAA